MCVCSRVVLCHGRQGDDEEEEVIFIGLVFPNVCATSDGQTTNMSRGVVIHVVIMFPGHTFIKTYTRVVLFYI